MTPSQREPRYLYSNERASELSSLAHAFLTKRTELNAIVNSANNPIVKRFYNLDHNTYLEGELSALDKELVGLAVSMAFRCDDCICYHIIQAWRLGASERMQHETLDVALLDLGSIEIPHLRRAYALIQQLYAGADSGAVSATDPQSTWRGGDTRTPLDPQDLFQSQDLQSAAARKEAAPPTGFDQGLTHRYFQVREAALRPGELGGGLKTLMALSCALAVRSEEHFWDVFLECRERQIATPRIKEALTIALIVGGFVVMPLLKKSWGVLAALEGEAPSC